MSVRIKQNLKIVATVKKSISLILCSLVGLSKELKDMLLVFRNIQYYGRNPPKTVMTPEAQISPRESPKL
jgi:hypothetical protein